MVHQKAGWASAWRPGPTEKRPAAQEQCACAGRARGAVTTCSSPARRHGGTLSGGSVVAGQQQGAACELAGATGRAPDMAVGGRSSPKRRCGVEAVEGALVAGGEMRVASNGDNGGGWEGLTVKQRGRWCSDGNRRGGGGLRRWEPARWTHRGWRRRGARAQARVWNGAE
jgi:hypothetical protein